MNFTYEVITSESEAVEILKAMNNGRPTSCDIETDGLYTYTRLIQVYQPGIAPVVKPVYVLDMDTMELDTIKLYLRELHTVWYNASYDLGTLNITTKKVDDLFYATKTAYAQFMEFGLAKVIDKLAAIGLIPNLYDGIDKASLQKKGFVRGAYLSMAQLTYSAIDVYVLALMWELGPIQDVINNNLAYKVDMISLGYAIQYQQNGLVVDNEMRMSMLEDANRSIEKYTNLLPDGLNPNSSPQVRALLGTAKADRATLVAYSLSDADNAAYAEYIIALKSAKKQAKYLESINFHKMYTKFNPAGAISGRFTASGGDLVDGFNAQQIPRNLQPIFLQDTYDTVVVDEDYSTLELRLACAIFGEAEMYRQFIEGADLHTEMAAMVTGKKLHEDGLLGSVYSLDTINTGEWLTKQDRTQAKAVNFGYVFGMSAATYVSYAFTSYGIKVTLDEATEIRNAYFRKYPNIAKSHKHVWNNYKRPDFYVYTALGRKVKPKLGTDGINIPVQGSGAETTKLSVHYLIKDYPEVINYIFNVVHDAIYLRVPKDEKDLWSTRLRAAMLKGWTEISKTAMFKFHDIPMPF